MKKYRSFHNDGFNSLSSLLVVLCFLLSTFIVTPAYAASRIDITGPDGSGLFGYDVVVLPNGNIVVSDPYYDLDGQADAGAVYLYDGTTLALISVLTGSTAGDQLGYNDWGVSEGVQVLPSGNFVVISPYWSNGTAGRAGAVTWCSATTGCDGAVSPANSFVGTHLGDSDLGLFTGILENGDYMVICPGWDDGDVINVGAVTKCSGTGGCTGEATAANSLVGTQAGDVVGANAAILALNNGAYVVSSPNWANGGAAKAGAVTWCSGAGSCVGPVTAANSLVGTQPDDRVSYGFLTKLSNGNYVVRSPNWANGAAANAGAVTWCSGTTGCTGPVTPANSLVGAKANDSVGGHVVWALPNGNYVVTSPDWANGGATRAGAATWCSGATGCTGPVTTANSLVGTHTNDQIGSYGLTIFKNSNYTVSSSYWANGGVESAGAVTWCSGTTGCTGAVSPANSLVGSQTSDNVGWYGTSEVANGNYVVQTRHWANGSAKKAGAVTWCSGTTGCTGPVTADNSLVGAHEYDEVGSVAVLANGNYVVGSGSWDNGGVADAGAVTWCSGATGCTGPATPANSLVGVHAGDGVGIGAALTNGNYVVKSAGWDNGATADVGAVTWCNGTAGCTGPVTAANSLIGSTAGDQVGGTTWNSVHALSNGNYVVSSPLWSNGGALGAGAATWVNGTTGLIGVVTTTNSLVGTTAGDHISYYGVTEIDNSNYVVTSYEWDNGAVADAGAVTWAVSAGGSTTGPITNQNSVLGETVSGGGYLNFAYDGLYGRLVVGRPADNKVTVVFLVMRVYLPLVMR